MKLTIQLCCFLVAWIFHWSHAVASATMDEFENCHRISSTMLRECLDDSNSDACWDKAKSANKACYTMVHDQYRKPAPKRIEAEKEAIKKATAAQRLEMERRSQQGKE
jgi:hypothetical protein